MKKLIMLLGLLSQLFTGKAQKDAFSKYPVYSGNDLGLTYSTTGSKFRIWAPTAEKAELLFYSEGVGGQLLSTIELEKSEGGTWLVNVPGDQKGKFYVFRVMIDKKWMNEVPDPYVKAVGVNGKRGMIIDPEKSNPANWQNDKMPVFPYATDAIIYELHVRDASIAANSGITNKGKFIGLTEKGTKNAAGLSTGLDHLKELGVTHIHLLPCFDFSSVDETKPDAKYNWGYDPQNYNVPEGSYSTDPNYGWVRNREFKQLIQTFHANGLRVVMDVVYNHTAVTEASVFNQLVPGYYYRQTNDGKFSNATACGNETASERPMMRKFMLESMKYWVQEYHVDGFRVDLMGVHDIVTMNLISKELQAIKPGILLYGEGWTAGASPLSDSLRALKASAYRLDHIAVFSDDIRDGIKGSVFEHSDKGFASGKAGMEESIKFGVVASCRHPQVNYKKVNYSKEPYAVEPYQTITYCECHDNHVLWDKLAISAKETTEEERKKMQKLALSIVLTSQGIAFLHAGTEFLRTKKGVENSFESPDAINAIDWSLKSKNKDVFEYVKKMIQLRKDHPAFRMETASEIAVNIRFLDNMPPGVVAYTINGAAVGDKWKKILVIYNGNRGRQRIDYPTGPWSTFDTGSEIKYPSRTPPENYIEVGAFSCTILYQ